MRPDRRFTAEPELRYISRLDTPETHAWRVQYVRGLSKPIQEYFTDAALGGKDAALQAAIRFRDAVVAAHAPPPPPPWAKARRNLKFGDKPEEFVGISLVADARTGRKFCYCWSAQIHLEGKIVRRRWSIRAHGYVGAFRLASKFRNEMTGQPFCETPPAAPDEFWEWAALEGIGVS